MKTLKISPEQRNKPDTVSQDRESMKATAVLKFFFGFNGNRNNIVHRRIKLLTKLNTFPQDLSRSIVTDTHIFPDQTDRELGDKNGLRVASYTCCLDNVVG
jgi:hypothetical protein